MRDRAVKWLNSWGLSAVIGWHVLQAWIVKYLVIVFKTNGVHLKRMFMIVSCSSWYPEIIQSVLLHPIILLLAANQKSLSVNTHPYWLGGSCYLSITGRSSFSLVALAWERWINLCKELYCRSVFNLRNNLFLDEEIAAFSSHICCDNSNIQRIL